jgi:hypothetical protein
MLYYCQYTWHPGATLKEVRRQQAGLAPVLEQSGIKVRGYYGLVGGGAGFLLLEADNPQAINDLLVPTMQHLAWDVRQVIERDLMKELRESAHDQG